MRGEEGVGKVARWEEGDDNTSPTAKNGEKYMDPPPLLAAPSAQE